jgi:hypothetical protein
MRILEPVRPPLEYAVGGIGKVVAVNIHGHASETFIVSNEEDTSNTVSS